METKYTQEEVLRNIDTFQKKEDDLINQRKEYWEMLDISQLKLL